MTDMTVLPLQQFRPQPAHNNYDDDDELMMIIDDHDHHELSRASRSTTVHPQVLGVVLA